MSWLARSIANTLRIEDEDDDNYDVVPSIPSDLSHSPSPTSRHFQPEEGQDESELEEEALSRGVREDLTEIKQTLTRQFWGVASFLAPPPSHPSTPSYPRPHQGQARPHDWNRFEPSNQSDLSISGDEADPSDPISVLKMRSNYDAHEPEHLQEEEYFEDDWGRAVGITEEVLTFATNIAMHPETWIDFPIDEEEDNDDFEMSHAQKEHAFTIERLAPRLAALRIELCPCHMSESYFWKVYFVLLHSRLNKYDAEILSTPQVAAARSMWMQELQKQTKQESKWYGRNAFELKDSSNALQEDNSPMSFHDTHSESTLPWTFTSEPSISSMSSNYESEKHQMESSEMQSADKSTIVQNPSSKNEYKNLTVGSSSKFLIENYEDESDDWLEEDSELGGPNGIILPLENEEDISFSDLEDDNIILPTKFKIASKEWGNSTENSSKCACPVGQGE